MSARTHGINLNFEALSKYGINSHRKAISIVLKAGKSRPKCLSGNFTKESLDHWSNPDGKNFFLNFSLNITMENQNTQDGHQTEDEGNDDQNSTLTVEIQNDDMQEDLPLISGQNSVVSEVSLYATENEKF